VIPRCENINKFGDNIPIHATKIVSKSGDIPPKAPASLFLLFTAVKIIYGTKKCVNKSMTFHPKNIFKQFYLRLIRLTFIIIHNEQVLKNI
jgi:hypothetical protein